MTVLIQANNIGSDAGPFDIFSQVNGYTEAFETGITAAQLIVGFVSYNVPDGTTVVRLLSVNSNCNNHEDIVINIPPVCTNQTIVFQLCNTSATVQDDFDIFLNGIKIGDVSLNQSAQVGSVMVGSNVTQIITQPDFACPLGNMQLFFFDPDLISYRNSITMTNTQNNGNGNVGTLSIRNYNVVNTSLETPCVVQDFNFSGSSGDSFNFTWIHSQCCNDFNP
jgi:hypothetical protein